MGMTLNRKLKIVVDDLKKYDPEKIILFGSTARGDADNYSDLDILVIKRTDKPFVKRLRSVALMCRLNEPIDILVYTPEELNAMRDSFFIENILRQGVVLYEK